MMLQQIRFSCLNQSGLVMLSHTATDLQHTSQYHVMQERCLEEAERLDQEGAAGQGTQMYLE